MSREIKFEFIYQGMPYSGGNPTKPWIKKVYTLDQLCDKSLSELSDVHQFSTLIAKRQYTGLKDANGVEIYEGDIVECDEHYYYEISWSEKYHSWDASECGGLADLPAEIKVIGNIYEHPHLLGDSK